MMTAMTSGFLPSPSHNGFYVGPLFVHAYGLAYVVAVLAAVTITARRWQALGGDRALVYDVALWGFPAGVIGGRLYFIATSWSEVPPHWWGPFAIWKGGLGIWGGIALGTLAGIWVLRRRGANVTLFMDAAAPGLLVAQAIGRIGNYFNQELFGGPSKLPVGARDLSRASSRRLRAVRDLPADVPVRADLEPAARRRARVAGPASPIKPPGLFALYVAGYSFARIGEELLRVDPAHHIFGLRLNFYVAAIICLAGLAWFVRIQRTTKPPGDASQPPPEPVAQSKARPTVSRS